jgi:tetratricopeptide (TPR) repeat protein
MSSAEAGAKQRPNTGGSLDANEVALALENVGQLFGGSGEGSERGGGRTPVGQAGRLLSQMSRGRARVDSQARPYEFFVQHTMTNEEKKAEDEYQNFSVHGINTPALRARIESRAIDQKVLDRVKSDFLPHDKLSEQQVANLDELVTKAHKLHLEKDPGAEKLYQLVLDVDPVHYECLTNLAKIAYSRHDLDRSRSLFERAIVLRPEHEKNIYYLAIVLFDMEQYDRSKALLEEVVQELPGSEYAFRF